MMKNSNWSTLTAVAALLIGVILFWSFGKDWLNLGSPLVFLAGLIGVAVPVLIFAAWKIYQRSDRDGK
jgi:hypothetical protein